MNLSTENMLLRKKKWLMKYNEMLLYHLRINEMSCYEKD